MLNPEWTTPGERSLPLTSVDDGRRARCSARQRAPCPDAPRAESLRWFGRKPNAPRRSQERHSIMSNRERSRPFCAPRRAPFRFATSRPSFASRSATNSTNARSEKYDGSTFISEVPPALRNASSVILSQRRSVASKKARASATWTLQCFVSKPNHSRATSRTAGSISTTSTSGLRMSQRAPHWRVARTETNVQNRLRARLI